MLPRWVVRSVYPPIRLSVYGDAGEGGIVIGDRGGGGDGEAVRGAHLPSARSKLPDILRKPVNLIKCPGRQSLQDVGNFFKVRLQLAAYCKWDLCASTQVIS